MTRATASIALAAYNGGAHLTAQLESFRTQKFLPDELLVADDGSTDDTIAIVQDFARSAPFSVRLLAGDGRLGLTGNFSRAIAACSGDVIFLSDQDDAWLPEKLETVMGVLDGDPDIQLVMNDKIMADANLRPVGTTMLGNIRGFGSPDTNFVAGCCAAFRRGWRDIVLPVPDAAIAYDNWIIGLAYRLGVTRIIERPMQLYRRHDRNVSQNAYSAKASVGRLSRLREELASTADNARREFRLSIAHHRAEVKRIVERRRELALLDLGSNAARALMELDEVIHAEERRRALLDMPRIRRGAEVARLMASGSYRHFSGWKSALKDLAR